MVEIKFDERGPYVDMALLECKFCSCKTYVLPPQTQEEVKKITCLWCNGTVEQMHETP